MRRRLCLVGLLVLAFAQGFVARSDGPAVPESTHSWPKDTTPYARPAVPGDFAPGGVRATFALPSGIGVTFPLPGGFIVDVVVNNTDPTLTNTDTFNDGEASIAVNPLNPDEIVITTFSGTDGANTPLWHSTDGGNTWTKRFTIPAAPGVSDFLSANCGGGVCDQTVDYGRNNQLSGSFLADSSGIHSGTTTNPASAAAWNWRVIAGVTQATNFNNSPPPGSVDQPWLLVNRDPIIEAQDNVYGAYDDFTNGNDCVGNACNIRVSVSYGLNPPNFTADNQSGTATGSINPGHRLAVDPSTGFVYSLFQRNIADGVGGSKNIDYMLNRSTDGGLTWSLNGSATGIIVANADSTQPTPKFGTVNALLGGVLHAAVDPNTRNLFYVYGNRDPATGNNRLALRRIVDDGAGGVIIGAESFVTGQVQAAIPSVAVGSDGTVGVFCYTFDGISSDNFPIFTAHLFRSQDQGVTFTDLPLLTFLSSAPDNGKPRQRVFGDYMQMKAVGNNFDGAFTGNGVPFGRPFANHDPIFFHISTGKKCPLTQGFWKTHPSAWPITSLTLGSQTYTQAELLALFETSPRGDASLILAQQLIAAKLNIANGSDPTSINTRIADADSLLSGFAGKLPYGVTSSSATGRVMLNDATVLDGYNNGQLTPVCNP